MNWQIFFSTFALIFLAELGDKTQLAAMARVATSGSARWTIFFGASSALVLSTLIAVLFGSTITSIVPVRYIKMGAGVLFLLFGFLILREALSPAAAGEAVSLPVPAGVSALVFREAAAFEKSAFEDYQTLADKVMDPRLRALLAELAEEEATHVRTIEQAKVAHPEWEVETGLKVELPTTEQLTHDAAAHDRPLLQHVIEHEKATAGFYAELARLTPVPALRKAFSSLAAAEQNHVQRLESLLRTIAT